jgi:hypothetical protein
VRYLRGPLTNLFIVYVVVMGILVGAVIGYKTGTEYPPCVPGAQRVCQGTLDSVQYCTEHGFGWESCQSLKDPIYPQALWRK